MAPKKPRLSKNELDHLLQEYGVIFEGPIKPSRWPKNHAGTFNVIRDIWKVRHDEYETSGKSLAESVFSNLRKAKAIAMEAHRLRFGPINESTWRHLENDIMAIFEGQAVCDTCKNELHSVEHEAQPLADHDVAQLRKKRQHRKACICRQQHGSGIFDPIDDEEDYPIVFACHHSMAMTHHPADDLKDKKIPMAPDRTIGLSARFAWRMALRSDPPDVTHFPMQAGTDILYPFLLIEAKRTVNTPGFTAIEAQTAFPIRRLIMQQKDLYRRAETAFDPLVWFFGYQGEEWRLYAGTSDQDKVRVYDLWHGTVESEDGALQLLQIVGYLWSWARDVYRPQIRNSLHVVAHTLREISPATNSTLSRSQSVLSDWLLGSQRTHQLDTVMEDHENIQMFPIAPEINQRLLSYGTQHPNLNLHAFSGAGLRHSDVVKFKLRVVKLQPPSRPFQHPSSTIENSAVTDWPAQLVQAGEAFILERSQMRNIATSWLGFDTAAMDGVTQTVVRKQQVYASFHFQSFIQETDWQIVRALTCMYWDATDLQAHDATMSRQASASAAVATTDSIDLEVVLPEQLSRVRNMTGSASISHALLKTRLTLSYYWGPDLGAPPVQWAPNDSSLVEDVLQRLASVQDQDFVPLYDLTESRISEAKAWTRQELDKPVPLGEYIGQKGGVLVRKPQSWPSCCPKFCLFVLVDVEANDKDQLAKVLLSVIGGKSVKIVCIKDTESGSRDATLDADDKSLLKRWLHCYKS